MNPSLGRNFEAMDPREWLASRVRGERPDEEEAYRLVPSVDAKARHL